MIKMVNGKPCSDHIADWHHFINLSDAINKPLAIFKSATTKTGIIVLTELRNAKQKPLIVALHIDTKKGIESLIKSEPHAHIGLLNSCCKDTKIFKIASIYARKDFDNFKWWICKGKDLYLKRGTPLYNFKKTKTQEACQEVDKRLGTARKKRQNTPKTTPPKGGFIGKPPKNNGDLMDHNTPVQTMQTIMENTGNGDLFKLNGRIGAFLGNIERKPKGAVFMTLDAPPSAGKTRFMFQMINEFAQDGYPLRRGILSFSL